MGQQLTSIQPPSLSFKIHFFVSLFVLIIVMYCSTGTLSPYANTVDFPPDYPLVEPKCHYLFNGDYYQLAALYYLLKGKPKQSWEYTMHLRRILYNFIAYPFMRLFQHDLGGLIANFILTILAFISFAQFTLKTTGESGSIAGMWLLALFPGISYYVGQPFLYSLIVPSCLWMYMLLWKLDHCTAMPPGRYSTPPIPLQIKKAPDYASARFVFIICLCIGLFFLAYDFIVFILPATVFVLAARRRYAVIPLAIAAMLLFTALWWCIVHFNLGTSFSSQNTVFYTNVVQSYFAPLDLARWFDLLDKVPEILVSNFLFSCFFFLPMLFLFSLLLGYYKRRVRLKVFETCLLISIALVFLFNNCAPPYDKPWQMRGDWIARLYEPMFVVMLFYCVRVFQDRFSAKKGLIGKLLMTIALFIAIAGNGTVAFGPILNDPTGISSTIYWRFYKHAPKETMEKNLAIYGRRPWGFCR